jgi:hypothetical protein
VGTPALHYNCIFSSIIPNISLFVIVFLVSVRYQWWLDELEHEVDFEGDFEGVAQGV